MQVAKVYHAANSPLSSDKVIKKGGRSLAVSSYTTIIAADGQCVGYTSLQKTKATDVDRVQIGTDCFEVFQLDSANTDAIKYCICIDDLENKWLSVVSSTALPETSKDLKSFVYTGRSPRLTFNRQIIIPLTVGCFAFIAAYACLSNISTIKKSVKQISTEQVSKTVQKGKSKTYTYGAKVDGKMTAEDILNSQIEEDSDNAAKERAGIASVSAEDTEVVITQNSATDSKSSKKKTKSSKKDKSDSNADESSSEAPFSSIEDTVITPANTNVSDTSDSLAEVFSPGIGDITISKNNPDYTISNPTEQKMIVEIFADDKQLASVTVDPNEKTSITLFNKITETTKASIKYTFKNSDGDTVRVIKGKFKVYVI